MSDKYNGQLWGGPDHGDIISANVERVVFRREDWMWPDGDQKNPTVTKTIGFYVWSEEEKRFNWEGPLRAIFAFWESCSDCGFSHCPSWTWGDPEMDHKGWCGK